MKYQLVFVLFGSLACGRQPKQETVLTNRDTLTVMFEAKTDEYMELTKDVPGRWPSASDCDAALWAGLVGRAGLDVDVDAGVQEDGRTTRKPFIDCLVPGESKSTTSNDMIAGLILGLHHQRKLNLIQRMYDYGTLNKWIMGFPTNLLSRVLLKSNGQSLLARAIFDLGGKDLIQRKYPLVYVPLQDDDYPTHLQFISMLTAQDVKERSYLNELIVQETCRNNPGDAFGRAVCGDYSEAAKLLLSEDYTPPPYVRGSEVYRIVHWLISAKLVLENT